MREGLLLGCQQPGSRRGDGADFENLVASGDYSVKAVRERLAKVVLG